MSAAQSKLIILVIQILVGVVLVLFTHNYVIAILMAAFVIVWSCRLYFEFRARNSS